MSLRKTQPSCEDEFDLLGVEFGPVSQWMMCGPEDIAAHCERISDKKRFHLGLSELKAVSRQSPGAQLVNQYAIWFWNSR